MAKGAADGTGGSLRQGSGKEAGLCVQERAVFLVVFVPQPVGFPDGRGVAFLRLVLLLRKRLVCLQIFAKGFERGLPLRNFFFLVQKGLLLRSGVSKR